MEVTRLYEVIEAYHDEQIEKLQSGQTPVSLAAGAQIALHLIPENAFLTRQEFDLFQFDDQSQELLKPIFSEEKTFLRTYDFDGLRHRILDENKNCRTYVHVFRSGIIQAVDVPGFLKDTKIMPIYLIEQEILFRITEYLRFQKTMGAAPPIAVYIDLLHVKGLEIKDPSVNVHRWEIHPFLKEHYHIPRLVVDTFETDLNPKFKVCCDRIWNACGYPRSFGYNLQGKRIYFST